MSKNISFFIERLYENALGRQSDLAGLNNWITNIQTSNAATVAKGFF
jgi:hypothetical protein